MGLAMLYAEVMHSFPTRKEPVDVPTSALVIMRICFVGVNNVGSIVQSTILGAGVGVLGLVMDDMGACR